MFHKKRYAHVLVMVSCLLLAGFDGFKCTDDNSGNNNSSGGNTVNRVRVGSEQKISESSGGFNGQLSNGDQFGSAVADLGDLEGDGVRDLAVGAPFDDDNGNDKGAAWVLFMDDNGRVDQQQKISGNSGGFGGNLDDDDLFGSAVAGIGDLNGDGAFDLAVGAPGNDDGGTDRGGLWIVFLNAEGRVRNQQKIGDGAGGFDGGLADDDRFGSAIADIGDQNDDGVTDLGVGAPNDDDGPDNAGAVWVLMMKTDGRVDDWQQLSDNAGGFGGDLDADDHFGAAIAGIGNLDNSGLKDLAVGAPGDDSGGAERGAVWILFMERRN